MKRFVVLSMLLLSLAVAVACGGSSPPPATPEAIAAVATEAPPPTATRTPVPVATPTPAATPTPVPTEEPVVEAAVAVPLTEVRQLRIPRFDVASAIEAIGILPSNHLDVPKNPHNTGWYSIFDAPGIPGNAVFSAHVDYFPNIKGPFNRLASLQAGDHVVVVANEKTLVYEVVSNVRYSVYSIPMAEIIWPTTRPAEEEWITLITCGGRFVASRPGGPGEYLDRDVVVARRIE